MLCPKCASEKSKVEKTIKTESIIRIRKCLECKYVFTTIEIIRIDKNAYAYAKEFKGYFDE